MRTRIFRADERHAPKQNGIWLDNMRHPWRVLQILRWEMLRPDHFVAVFVAEVL